MGSAPGMRPHAGPAALHQRRARRSGLRAAALPCPAMALINTDALGDITSHVSLPGGMTSLIRCNRNAASKHATCASRTQKVAARARGQRTATTAAACSWGHRTSLAPRRCPRLHHISGWLDRSGLFGGVGPQCWDVRQKGAGWLAGGRAGARPAAKLLSHRFGGMGLAWARQGC